MRVLLGNPNPLHRQPDTGSAPSVTYVHIPDDYTLPTRAPSVPSVYVVAQPPQTVSVTVAPVAPSYSVQSPAPVVYVM